MTSLDLLLRAATGALAIAAAVAIVLRPVRHPGKGYAAFAVAGIAAFMVASAPGAHAELGLAVFAFHAWCLATPVAVWMLSRVLFSESPPLAAMDLALSGAFVVITMAGDYGRFQLGPLADDPVVAAALLFAGRIVSVALLAAACMHAIAHWRTDLVEQRRRVRAAFVGVIGAVFVASALSEIVLGRTGTPIEFVLVENAALLALAFVLLQFVARGGVESLLPAERPQPHAMRLAVVRNDAAEAALAHRVCEAMERERLWKRERLGVAELAGIVGSHEHLLRRAIHRHLGYRNFDDFLNDYRLREAAARLADPAQGHLAVLTIARDCGYGSIGPFNRAFKARFGGTPTRYRSRAEEAASRSSA